MTQDRTAEKQITLMTQIIKFEDKLTEFKKGHEEEFTLRLEFPTINRQKQEKQGTVGFFKETLSNAALVKTYLKNQTQGKLPEYAVKLAEEIKELLTLTTLDQAFRNLCEELVKALEESHHHEAKEAPRP